MVNYSNSNSKSNKESQESSQQSKGQGQESTSGNSPSTTSNGFFTLDRVITSNNNNTTNNSNMSDQTNTNEQPNGTHTNNNTTNDDLIYTNGLPTGSEEMPIINDNDDGYTGMNLNQTSNISGSTNASNMSLPIVNSCESSRSTETGSNNTSSTSLNKTNSNTSTTQSLSSSQSRHNHNTRNSAKLNSSSEETSNNPTSKYTKRKNTSSGNSATSNQSHSSNQSVHSHSSGDSGNMSNYKIDISSHVGKVQGSLLSSKEYSDLQELQHPSIFTLRKGNNIQLDHKGKKMYSNNELRIYREQIPKMEKPLEWKFSQIKGTLEDEVNEPDIISTVNFNQDGELLATGDKGGRIVIFKRDNSHTSEYNVYSTFQSHEPEFDYLKSLEIEEKINKLRCKYFFVTFFTSPDTQKSRCPEAQMPRFPEAQMPRSPDAQMP